MTIGSPRVEGAALVELHRMPIDARLDITIVDRFGLPIRQREWFLVPIHVVDDVVRHLQDGKFHEFAYDWATRHFAGLVIS